MDFFGLGRTEFSTPVGAAIEKATNELLLGPDWAMNLEICDLINSRPDGATHAVKALKRRFTDPSPKTVLLALTVAETCMKNCNVNLHAHFASKDFLNEMVNLADGKKGWEVKESALGLIQQWGLAFQSKQDRMPLFYETFLRLKMRGVEFPSGQASAPIFTPPPTHHIAPMHAIGGKDTKPPVKVRKEAIQKLKSDLTVVQEKVKLCRDMLHDSRSNGGSSEDALSEVIGFLEACRPRMVDLIEAGMQGVLDSEDLLGLALKVNDDLLRVLESEKNGTPVPQAAEEGSLLIDLGDASLPVKKGPAKTNTTPTKKAIAANDIVIGEVIDENDNLSPKPSATNRPMAGATSLKLGTSSPLIISSSSSSQQKPIAPLSPPKPSPTKSKPAVANPFESSWIDVEGVGNLESSTGSGAKNRSNSSSLLEADDDDDFDSFIRERKNTQDSKGNTSF